MTELCPAIVGRSKPPFVQRYSGELLAAPGIYVTFIMVMDKGG